MQPQKHSFNEQDSKASVIKFLISDLIFFNWFFPCTVYLTTMSVEQMISSTKYNIKRYINIYELIWDITAGVCQKWWRKCDKYRQLSQSVLLPRFAMDESRIKQLLLEPTTMSFKIYINAILSLLLRHPSDDFQLTISHWTLPCTLSPNTIMGWYRKYDTVSTLNVFIRR